MGMKRPRRLMPILVRTLQSPETKDLFTQSHGRNHSKGNNAELGLEEWDAGKKGK
jgi:hypothetical protein